MEVRLMFNSDGRIIKGNVETMDEFYDLFEGEPYDVSIDFMVTKNGDKFIGVTAYDEQKKILGFA